MTLEDVPARHDRLAAAMTTHVADALKEAVKWVMEPEMLAIEAEVERRVREQVALEIEREHWKQSRAGKDAALLLRAAEIARGEAR